MIAVPVRLLGLGAMMSRRICWEAEKDKYKKQGISRHCTRPCHARRVTPNL